MDNKMINTTYKTKKSTIYFYVDSLIFLVFVFLAISGLTIQINYHVGHINETITTLGLNRYEWLLLHKILAVISVIGLSVHIYFHISWINAVLKRLSKKLNRNTRITIWLFIMAIATSATGTISWFLSSGTSYVRHDIIEIHDKLGIVLIVLLILHIINHWTWITNTLSEVRNRCVT